MTFEEFEEAIFVEYEKTKHTDIVSFLLERSFKNHKKSVMMAGDIGGYLSKIGDLERELKRGKL